jgi:hypothetical protein
MSISSLISFYATGEIYKLSSIWEGRKSIEELFINGIQFARLIPMFVKKSLKELAIDLQSVNSMLSAVIILDGRL